MKEGKTEYHKNQLYKNTAGMRQKHNPCHLKEIVKQGRSKLTQNSEDNTKVKKRKE